MAVKPSVLGQIVIIPPKQYALILLIVDVQYFSLFHMLLL